MPVRSPQGFCAETRRVRSAREPGSAREHRGGESRAPRTNGVPMSEERITITFVIDSLSFGGAERQLRLLVPALPDRFKPVVISLSREIEPFGSELRSRGVDVTALERRRHAEIGRLWRTMRIVRARDTDIVHGFLDAANAYAFLAGRALGKPVMLSFQSNTLRLSGLKGAALSWMMRSAETVLVNSKAGAEYLRTRIGVSDGRILHIPNWIDPKSAGPARPVPSPGAVPTIGFVGRFEPPKRLGLLLDVFERLSAIVPGARLVLQGDGSERSSIEQRVSRANLSERVEMVPANPEVDGTLRRLHVFVMTSAFEGLPNAAIEALSRGVPIVSTPVGDLGELVVEGKTGSFFESEDPGEMAATLAGALASRVLLENAAALGPKLVEEKFSIQRAVERLTDAYLSMTGR
jgi:GalNAc-alpha-(1->4)-GalNAc-alpha-(1->3)-diNAcBac-PP-undecaprenol alpha-1,4-N-acetyl-D-galactosaminyltransferase